MDMSGYRQLFLDEAREHLAQMGRLLKCLEQAPDDREALTALFRHAHSCKGMAAAMGYERTGQLAHHLEDTLAQWRAVATMPPEAICRLVTGLDLLEGLIDDLEAGQPEREVTTFLAATAPLVPGPVARNAAADHSHRPDPAAAERPQTSNAAVCQVTIDLAETAAAPAARGLLILRDLQRHGEILSSKPTRETLRTGGGCRRLQVWLRTEVPKPQLDAMLRSISDVEHVSFIDDRRDNGEGRRGPATGQTVRVRIDLLDQVVNLSGELLTQRYMLQRAAQTRNWTDLDRVLGQTTRLVGDLHQQTLRARLLPLENITGRIPRMVRDLAHKSDKQVEFQLTGGDIPLDRIILEELTDPLMHLIRNAVDHGIAEGTPGKILLAARREQNLVVIEVSDNGRGIDPAAMRRLAVERGVLTAGQAERLSERDALLLACTPGLSTAPTLTETSGRGVGMDVVKAAVEKLGGILDIHSTPGIGTRIQLRLPQSAAIIKVLLVSCGNRRIALPTTRVIRTLDLAALPLFKQGDQNWFQFDTGPVVLLSLAELLGIASSPDETRGSVRVVLVEAQGRLIGLKVARFLGQQDAFVKHLGFPLNRLPGLSGATVEADGNLVFIIDPHTLLEGRPVAAWSGQENCHELLRPE